MERAIEIKRSLRLEYKRDAAFFFLIKNVFYPPKSYVLGGYFLLQPLWFKTILQNIFSFIGEFHILNNLFNFKICVYKHPVVYYNYVFVAVKSNKIITKLVFSPVRGKQNTFTYFVIPVVEILSVIKYLCFHWLPA